ncbi:MAG: ethanolamine utilization protein [Candidatus Accumulibacter sp.]|jgi:DNA polymerase-3 subunit epsilon|nr:ethanolamine utilization protein [Accumulibacter sp.]
MNVPIPRHDSLVFVDLETTGANFVNDRIIEIGLVEVDGDDVREWSRLVDPEGPISPFIARLTGIDAAMLESAPTFAQLAPEILEKLRGRLFVAHNARFDYGFLKHEFGRVGIDFHATRLCTVKLSRALFPGHRRHNLDTLIGRFGIAVDGRHRALADARALWELWRRWHALLPAETIRAAVERIAGRPELPPRLDAARFDDLPETPGAYAVFGQDGAPLAVKRASNLRRQVFAHFSLDRRDSALARGAWRIEWREAAGELGARLRELELARTPHRPPEDLCSWQLVRHGEGDFRPALVFARDVDFARAEDLFGLYRAPKEAIQVLRKLAEAHRLCLRLTGLEESRAGEPCAAYGRGLCRGACVGKETVSLHSARLMTALARHRIRPWPHPGPIALIERDEFGMREDAHVIDEWAYLGTASDEAALDALFEIASAREDSGIPRFDPDIYRIVGKCLRDGRLETLTPAQRASGQRPFSSAREKGFAGGADTG